MRPYYRVPCSKYCPCLATMFLTCEAQNRCKTKAAVLYDSYSTAIVPLITQNTIRVFMHYKDV